MLGALGQLLPVGLAAAISSVPITAMILVLLSPRRNVAALPFLLGSVIGLLVVVTLATLAAQGLPDARAREPEVAGLIEIVVGCALCVLGVWTWPRRGRSGDAAPEPTWAAALDSLGP